MGSVGSTGVYGGDKGTVLGTIAQCEVAPPITIKHSNFKRTILVFVAFAAMGIVDPSRLENLAFADNVGFKMYRSLRIAAVGLLALSLFGCISSNPSSEVMVDTNAKTKQAMPGQPQNVVPASKLGDPTLSGE